MNYPLKLQVALTQACIDIHNANNINGIDDVLETQSSFESAGYHFPMWLSVWIKQLETDPLLTAEECFKQPKAQMSGFENMSFSIRYTNEELIEQIKIEAAIRAANDNHHPA
ncbi:MAG: hypothetical protein Q8J77_00100, partial [Methylotenera sp.]|nr:hypothetical protein [Methylotenera sp.]